MLKGRTIFAAIVMLSLGSCGWFKTGGVIKYIPAPPGYANEEEKISLLNPRSRYMIHCYATPFGSAEDCARKYERQNYVRYRNLPYKTAIYDFLTRETYPTRRWREHDRTPWW